MVDDDDSFVVVGHTTQDFGGVSAGSFDFIAIRLDADGNEVWRWQVCGYAYRFVFGRHGCASLILLRAHRAPGFYGSFVVRIAFWVG